MLHIYHAKHMYEIYAVEIYLQLQIWLCDQMDNSWLYFKSESSKWHSTPNSGINMELSRVKLINSRWAWGRCLERRWSHKHKNRAHRVTMTTPWAATTRHPHWKKKQLNSETYLIPERGREGWKREIAKHNQRARTHMKLTWPHQPSRKTARPPAESPLSLCMSATLETADHHCFVSNLA